MVHYFIYFKLILIVKEHMGVDAAVTVSVLDFPAVVFDPDLYLAPLILPCLQQIAS